MVLADRLAQAGDWGPAGAELAAFHAAEGTGALAISRVLRWVEGELVGVPVPDRTTVEDLVGYEEQRAPLLDDLRAFLHGAPANDALLHGLEGIRHRGRHLATQGDLGQLDLGQLDLGQLHLRDLDLGQLHLRDLEARQLDGGEGHGPRCHRVNRLLGRRGGLGGAVLRGRGGLEGGRLCRAGGLGGRAARRGRGLRRGRACGRSCVLGLGLVGRLLGRGLLDATGLGSGDLVGRRGAHELSSRESRGVSPARFSAWKAR
ncbi:MAG: DUF815 domain-containing protein [Candidatus Nanopelagicales bacterium]